MGVVAVIVPLLLLFIAVVTELASRGTLSRNRLVGIRTRATMRSDAAWSSAHRGASRTIWIGFALSALVAAITLVTDGTAATICGAIVAVLFLTTCVVALLQAHRAGARNASA